MRNLFSIIMLTIGVGIVITACDIDEELISTDELPLNSKSFLNTYFNSAKIILAEKDIENSSRWEYEVKLDNGIEISFDGQGEWQNVESRNDHKALPNYEFIDTIILDYVLTNYPEAGINGIDRQINGFDVELTNGVDLEFNSEGNFLRIDR